MRTESLFSLGLILAAVAPLAADEKKDVLPSKESYVKVRVEVEIRGVLRETDKGVTVVAHDRVYKLYNDAEEIENPSRATPYTLDFAAAKDLRELAKVLNGKEVVVAGKSELRAVMPVVPPGGHTGGFHGTLPSPTWSLQRTVLVTGLKSAK